jgi:hypothetical protein
LAAKVRISEQDAKGKFIFLFISEPKKQQVPSSKLEWPSSV